MNVLPRKVVCLLELKEKSIIISILQYHPYFLHCVTSVVKAATIMLPLR